MLRDGKIEIARPGKGMSIAIVALAEVAALTLWFSGTTIVPSLLLLYEIPAFHQSLFTSAVHVGFVVGTVMSALGALADRSDPRQLFACASTIAALANLAVLAVDPVGPQAVVLRFVTGVCMAGIYPVGMKIVSSWADGDTGLMMGLLVGALTLGSASPHLVNALGGLDWRVTVAACSAAALAAAVLVNFASLGPGLRKVAGFNPYLALIAWRNRPLRLANLGYLGHMWELYAMWAWLGIFLQAVLAPEGEIDRMRLASVATFAIIGVGGAIGSIGGGFIADRVGRTALTIAAMTVSGFCALIVGFCLSGPLWALILVCLVWGIAVVADSAQFSASIVELSDKDISGTMLTLQTCFGFLMTLVTIHLMPILVVVLGWRYAFASLAVGPFLGVWAMSQLRCAPEAAMLASGRR